MFKGFEVPKITEERLAELLPRIRPVVRKDGGLWYIKPVDPRRIAFLWDPTLDAKVEDLKELRGIHTFHDYGHPSLFKPSIAEVLAQIPADIVDETVAFETGFVDFDQGRDCHLAWTVFYGLDDECHCQCQATT